jgi:hypothetical protein
MDYKPYSAEWNRKRYLAEAIQKYFEDDASPEVVLGDIMDIVQEWEQYHLKQISKTQFIIKQL